MVGSAKNAATFIDRIDEASKTIAAKEYQTLLARKQRDVPGATVVNGWERDYYSELVRQSDYNFDSQSVRPYFPYDRVKQGVLDVTSKLFGVTFQPAKNFAVWYPSVEAYEMLEDGKSWVDFIWTCTRARASTTTTLRFQRGPGVPGNRFLRSRSSATSLGRRKRSRSHGA